jgi:altronate dehydratase small subunit
MDKVIVLNDQDNVATCLANLKPKDTVEVAVAGKRQSVTISDDVPFGHKIAVKEIADGEKILKYGEVIGVASIPISTGQHVHVHNVESVRGRGDKGGSE